MFINSDMLVLDGKVISLAILSVGLFILSTVHVIVTSNAIQDIKDALQKFFSDSVAYDENIKQLCESNKLISDNTKNLSDKVNDSIDDVLELLQKNEYVVDTFVINSLNEIKEKVQAIDKQNAVLTGNVAAILDSTNSSLKNIYKIVNASK